MNGETTAQPGTGGMVRVGIGLGANVGTRRWFLRTARESIEALPGVHGPLLSSRVYESSPVGCPPGSAPFLNAVIEVGWEANRDLLDLLENFQALERAFGRAPETERERNAPRPVDLDILYAGGQAVHVTVGEIARLEVPHPRALEREFVLRPLADLRPELVLPGAAAPVAELLAGLAGTQGVAARGQGWYVAEPNRLPGAEEREGVHLASALGKFVHARREGRRLATLTATDYTTGRLVDEGGIDLILVGDSLGMVALGLPDTTGVTLEDMVRHTAAVRRGARNTLIVADLPYGTYRSVQQALESAARLVEEGGADAVKLEGGVEQREMIRAITARGYPLLAHLGMLPQKVREEGGVYRIKGRTPEQEAALLEDARAIAEAGAFGVVLELVTPPVAQKITEALTIPTIGIGSGDVCAGEILVTADLSGAYPWFVPKFAQVHGDVAGQIRAAVAAWRQAVSGEG